MAELVLITGASSGIGLATVIACARRGFNIIATMRNLERRDQLDAEIARCTSPRARDDGKPPRDPEVHGAIFVEQLDVTSPGCEDKVRELLLKYGPIDHLVNNAGIAVSGAFEEQSDLDVRDQFETNVFGLMAVTRALLPSMRASGRGRVVNVSSIAGRIGLPAVAAYSATKHAVSGFSEALQHEVSALGIVVCLVEPGSFRAGIFQHLRRGHHVDPEGPYRDLTQTMMRALAGPGDASDGPEVVGAKIAELLGMDSPPFRTVVGNQARAAAALKRVAPHALFSSAMRRLMGL